jgi:sterol desaturase/sphingolipid hydroxylase (fatty acid hydroxylase superfamily)
LSGPARGANPAAIAIGEQKDEAMATAAVGRGQAGARWLVPAGLALFVLLGLLMSWAEPLVAPLAAQQKGLLLERFAEGGLAGYALGGMHGVAWIFIVILLRPMALLALVVLVEAALTRGERRPKDRLLAWTARGLFLTITYLTDMMLGRWIDVPFGPLLDFAGPASPSALHMLEMGVLFLLSLLVADFFQYWAHRAYHRFGLLWRFHAVHHAPRHLGVLRNFEHPVEAVFSWFLIAAPANLVIAGVDSSQLDLIAAFFLVQNDLVHTRARVHLGPLGWLLTDNRYHFIHHSRDPAHFNTNFAAIFPPIDRLFGTYCRPEGGALPETGLDDRLPPARLSHYFLANLPRAGAASDHQHHPASESSA